MSETDGTSENVDGEFAQLRAEVRRVADKLPMTVVAKEMGVAYGTFSAWIGGKYAGDNARIADAARAWIDAQASKKRHRASMPSAPGYVDTPTGRTFMATLDFAQYTPDFVMISGGAGLGKTTALRRYQSVNPNVWVLTCEPCFNTPRMLLTNVGRMLDLNETKYVRLSNAIQTRLRGSGGLLVIDEAQHLNSTSLDQLRTLHDLTDTGIAMVGNEMIYSRIEGHARQPQFAQLYSRVGMRTSRKNPVAGDVSALLDAWAVNGDDERRLLADIAKKPGALRGMTKTLRLAHMLSQGEALTARLIKMAWEQISSTKVEAT